jgi:hypothetical protein
MDVLRFFDLAAYLKNSLALLPPPGDSLIIKSEMELDGTKKLYLPKYLTSDCDVGGWVSYNFSYVTQPAPWEIRIVKPDSNSFELNLTEALVGWRQWYIQDDKLKSITQDTTWEPEVALEADCKCIVQDEEGNPTRHSVPAEFCRCGVYARNSIKIGDYDAEIWGEVYGWGRYVRGDQGWRSQYAYPKSFHLDENSVTPATIDVLKKYHVPIYVKQPMLLYNPEEDGYEHRNNETNGDFRPFPITDAPETSDEDYDEED